MPKMSVLQLKFLQNSRLKLTLNLGRICSLSSEHRLKLKQMPRLEHRQRLFPI